MKIEWSYSCSRSSSVSDSMASVSTSDSSNGGDGDGTKSSSSASSISWAKSSRLILGCLSGSNGACFTKARFFPVGCGPGIIGRSSWRMSLNPLILFCRNSFLRSQSDLSTSLQAASSSLLARRSCSGAALTNLPWYDTYILVGYWVATTRQGPFQNWWLERRDAEWWTATLLKCPTDQK